MNCLIKPNSYNIGLGTDEGCLCWNGEWARRPRDRFLQHFHHFLPLHNSLRALAPLLLFAARFPTTHSLFIVKHSPVSTVITNGDGTAGLYGIPSILPPHSVTAAVSLRCFSLHFRRKVVLYPTIKYRYLTLCTSRQSSFASWNFMVGPGNHALSVLLWKIVVCPGIFPSFPKWRHFHCIHWLRYGAPCNMRNWF